MELEKIIRDVPDFPQPGILFKDITTLLQDGAAFAQAVDQMLLPYQGMKIDKIVAVESRGFIFGGIMAYRLGCGFVPARKAGKLPWKTIRAEYTLEYGSNVLEMHVDAVKEGERVILVDDLLATGGTAAAVARMLESQGAVIAGISFLIELDFLKGRTNLTQYPVHSLIHF